jgi:chromosome segregation protein
LAALLDQIDRDGHLVLEAGDQVSADLPIDDAQLPDVQDFPVRISMLENESLITEWVERVEDSRRKVGMLGEVNLAALEEFVELRARHVYLEEQRADLEESVAAIRKAIAQINRTCRERFREAYDKVNLNFQCLYPRLVGGGSARLQLTNEDDLLETGVEIFAQPPGKRLQNLNLLSGGEKAMTALALIFSLFQVKPSPFCLLDEVDAPLDDSNGARFNQMLREMSETSQFIVITHNKKTMEVMDTLYGVTMPKPGQSRLVSVQIH